MKPVKLVVTVDGKRGVAEDGGRRPAAVYGADEKEQAGFLGYKLS